LLDVNSLLPFLIPPLIPPLYAETHYRFRYFFSYLRKHEPELLADAPFRVEPGHPIPILILAKDAHHFPVLLKQIHVTAREGERDILSLDLLREPLPLREKLWWRVFPISVKANGWVDLEVHFEVECLGRLRRYVTDNYKTTSHAPLSVFVAREPLPTLPGLHVGECHSHSDLTDDQVEFGAPIEASQQLSGTMGLSFFCVTDHSYDLDDSFDNYLKNDPLLPKWKNLHARIDAANSSNGHSVAIRGEEVSCRNVSGENVHLLLLGGREFVPGSGDSAERWLRTRSEFSIEEILNKQPRTTIAFAAHPSEPVPLLQRMLLGRGQWTMADLTLDGLDGIQCLNGSWDDSFEEALMMWVKCLLQGKRRVLIGGNDAHGNFNRFRQISIPFLRLAENDRQLFGRMRTGVFLDEEVTEQSIVEALREGRAIITDIVHSLGLPFQAHQRTSCCWRGQVKSSGKSNE
jgi:hypothetical protein